MRVSSRAAELALWTAAIVAGAVAITGWRATTGGVTGSPPTPAVLAPPPAFRSPTADSIAWNAARVAAGDPFRIARRPASVSFGVEPPSVAPPPVVAKPPKPILMLAGILGGPPWEALLEGLPDRAGATLVRSGDVFAGLKVRAVSRDTVVVQGADTVWKLTLKRAWR